MEGEARMLVDQIDDTRCLKFAIISMEYVQTKQSKNSLMCAYICVPMNVFTVCIVLPYIGSSTDSSSTLCDCSDVENAFCDYHVF